MGLPGAGISRAGVSVNGCRVGEQVPILLGAGGAHTWAISGWKQTVQVPMPSQLLSRNACSG